MHKKVNVLSLLLVLCLLAGLAVGCTPGGNSAQTTVTTVAPDESDTTETTAGSDNSTNTGSDMSSIIRTTQDWPTYYDPAVGSSLSCSTVQGNVYDPLVFPQTDGTVAPHIATEWTVSDDNLTYTFHIRDDVAFHSGNKMKASDVVYSMNRLLEIGEGYAYLFKGVVESCEAPDDATVVMKLANPFGPFISTLVRVMVVEEALVTEHYDLSVSTYGEKGDYGKSWMLTHDAGSGPYKTKEFKLDEYFLGERFDEYWGGWEENAPQYFKISNMTDPVAVRTAMANKELEITDELQPLENYETMAKMDGVDVAAYESGNNCNLMFNTQLAPMDDVHFHKALAYAFDYDTVLTSIYPGAVRAVGPVPPSVPGFDEDLVAYTYDLDKAKEELALSKYVDDPEMMKLDLTWCAEVPEQEKISLLIQANFAELGIEVEITKKPFGSMITDAQKVETTPHMSIVNFAPSYFEAGSMLKTRYHSSSTGTWEQMEWLMDDELDHMIDAALETVDRDERFAMYNDIQQYVVDVCPTIWLFAWVERHAVQSAYVTWNAWDAVQANEPYLLPLGFSMYARAMRVNVAE